MATAPKYYTYQPNAKNVPNVKPGHPLQGNQLILKPGEKTGFTPGKGFYAIPGAPAPAPAAPAVTVPAPAAPQWNMPDYSSLIQGDYGVQQAEAEGQKALGEGETSFQNSLKQAFIDLGASDVSKLGDYAKYIDQATIEAAKANKFSRLAQSLKSQTANLRRGRAALAARGMLSSGQATSDTLDQQNEREAADYGSLRDFLSGGAQGMQGLASLRSSIAQQIAAAREAAAQRAAAAYQPQQGQATAVPGTAPPQPPLRGEASPGVGSRASRPRLA